VRGGRALPCLLPAAAAAAAVAGCWGAPCSGPMLPGGGEGRGGGGGRCCCRQLPPSPLPTKRPALGPVLLGGWLPWQQLCTCSQPAALCHLPATWLPQAAEVASLSEGAMCVFVEGKEVPLIVQKSDGGFGYASTDMAAIKQRLQVGPRACAGSRLAVHKHRERGVGGWGQLCARPHPVPDLALDPLALSFALAPALPPDAYPQPPPCTHRRPATSCPPPLHPLGGEGRLGHLRDRRGPGDALRDGV
jgi:hypothetical protein